MFSSSFLPLDATQLYPDRFCAAEQVDGKWNVFTGDQIGALLGYQALLRYRQSGLPIGQSRLLISLGCARADATRNGTMSRKVGNVRFDRFVENVEIDSRERRVRVPRNIDWLQVRSRYSAFQAWDSSSNLIDSRSNSSGIGGLEMK